MSRQLYAPTPPPVAPLTVRCLECKPAADGGLLRLGLRLGEQEREIFFRFQGAPITPDPDAWAALALPLAMRRGEPLHLKAPVSRMMEGALAQLAEIHACWYPEDLRKVPVQLTRRHEEPSYSQGKGVACFFSGGVDSFYTVRKHQAELTHLIFVHGFDIPLENHGLREHVVRHLREAATALGMTLIEVETNVRSVTDPYLTWGTHYLAIPMAAIALLLGDTIDRCYLPSAYSYAYLRPGGWHPLLTALLSSPAVQVILGGADAERSARVRSLADDALARRHLRVCWRNPDNAYNCGRCEKCLRTMSVLRALGKLDQFPVFPGSLDLAAISRLDYWPYDPSWPEVLAWVQTSGTDRPLERALLAMRRRSRLAHLARSLRDRLPAGLRRCARQFWEVTHRKGPRVGNAVE